MRYSLNEVIDRLYLKTAMNIDNRHGKINFLCNLFNINEHISNNTLIDSLYNANHNSPKKTDYPQLKKDITTTQFIQNKFSNNNFYQYLFDTMKNSVWNSLQSETKEHIFKYRKDIFADFRYDSVTRNKLDDNLIKTIEILLESNNENSFVYVILLFILIAIFHNDINKPPISDMFEQKTIKSILKDQYTAQCLDTLNNSISNKYDKDFIHPQYENFNIYLYEDTGNYTSHFCYGKINFKKDGIVTLEFQNEKSASITKYSGKAHLFTANKLIHITLEDDATHRGALLCFHYTEFIKEPKKCFLRKGFFISTGAADEHYRPFVKNIILLHKETDQKELINGLLKCCNMRTGKEFIILRKASITQFIDRLYKFDFMLTFDSSNSSFKNFFKQYEHNDYCFVKEDEFLKFVTDKLLPDLDEWSHIKIILLLKSFSESPNAIYSYMTPDPTFQIFI